jgi:hypothetical protein
MVTRVSATLAAPSLPIGRQGRIRFKAKLEICFSSSFIGSEDSASVAALELSALGS